jgi:hypothetical protein
MGTVSVGAVARRARRAGPVLALVVAVGLVGAGCEARCEPPYRAVAGQQTYPVPAGSWPVAGTALPWAPALDTDGDGARDTFELSDDLRRLVVHRSSGDLTLTAGAGEQLWATDPGMLALGDLDGDGRTDLGLTVQADGPARHVVVRGALADGTYDVGEVGAPVLPMAGDDRPWPLPAGDLDADGRDDVMVVTRVTTTVWSGADLDLVPPAPGGPGARGGPPAPVPPAPPAYELDRTASPTPVPLTPSQTALVLLEESVVGGGTVVTVTLWALGIELAFTTEGGEVPVTAPIHFTSAAVVEDGEQRWLTLGMDYRQLHERWAWDLDDVCAAVPAGGA